MISRFFRHPPTFFVLTSSHHRNTAAFLAGLFLTALLAGCGTPPIVPSPSSIPALHEDDFTSFDQHHLPYQCWLPSGKTKLVVIGFHGISGASNDMENLGLHLSGNNSGTAVYAPDIRGQGNDPIEKNRGDIRAPSDWIGDAHTFTDLVRQKHPGVPVVWCGESMGALIVLHACTSTAGHPPCDALILSSPVSSTGDDITAFQLVLLRVAATIMPRYRVSLETLAGVDNVQMTRDEVHEEQTTTNPWHVSGFTLRLLRYLERMISNLSLSAQTINIPTLILHGGRDIFSDSTEVERFAKNFPTEAVVQRRFYPESYHLLFYDHQRDQVLADVSSWLDQLKLPSPK